MPIPKDLDPDLKKILFGDPWGRVFPDRPNLPPLAVDGRTVALRTLRSYLAALEFRRPGNRKLDGSPGDPASLHLDPRNIHIGWPDYEVEMQFPSVVFLHQQGSYERIGFNSYVQEETQDVFAPGTIVQWQSEYTEHVIVEVWANKQAELRSLLEGIVVALSPTENMYGIRFRMPEYFDQLVCFTPHTRQEFDEDNSARNRRRGRIEVEMRYTVVALVNVQGFEPAVQVHADVDPDTNEPICDEAISDRGPTIA